MLAYEELVKSLDQLVNVYRHLLDTVQKENKALLVADMKAIPEINIAKERLVLKVRELDSQWMLAAQDIAVQFNMPNTQPTLLELASQFQTIDKEELKSIHKVLSLIVQHISEVNKANETLVRSALSHISGAMNSITTTLNENPTYRKSGNMKDENQDAQGRLVQKEV